MGGSYEIFSHLSLEIRQYRTIRPLDSGRTVRRVGQHRQSEKIEDYDTIIFGEGVYAGQFKTAKHLIPIIEKHPNKRYIFFMVGIADMEDPENREKLYGDLAKAMGPAVEKVKVFSCAEFWTTAR